MAAARPRLVRDVGISARVVQATEATVVAVGVGVRVVVALEEAVGVGVPSEVGVQGTTLAGGFVVPLPVPYSMRMRPVPPAPPAEEAPPPPTPPIATTRSVPR